MLDFIVDSFPIFKKLVKLYNTIIWYIYCLFYDFWNFSFSSLDDKSNDLKKSNYESCYNYNKYKFKLDFIKFFFNKNYLNIDMIWLKFFSLNYKLKNYKNNPYSSFFSVISTNQGFYFNFLEIFESSKLFFFLKNSFLSGYKYMWLGLSFWIFPLIGCFGIMYITLVLSLLPFNKIMFSWMSMLMFSYWLLSGFVFFFKKYQFGKYTTSIQSFWSSSYILFWLLEGATFGVFLFLTINSSQESFYMFDQINVFKTHLYSWKFFFLKLFPLVMLILLTYFFMVSLKWNLFSKHSAMLLVLTLFLTYTVWLEFYQFYHVLNFYGNLNWIYDVDDHSWSLEQDPSSTRIVNHYINLLFMLKFWHIVFMYGFWLFFVLSCMETKSISYPLLSANYQNFIMLYMFAWVFMYPWFKFFFSSFLDSPYYWFYVNNSSLAFSVIFSDFKLMYYGMIEKLKYTSHLFYFNNTPFFYWQFSDSTNSYEIFSKHIMKESILKSLL